MCSRLMTRRVEDTPNTGVSNRGTSRSQLLRTSDSSSLAHCTRRHSANPAPDLPLAALAPAEAEAEAEGEEKVGSGTSHTTATHESTSPCGSQRLLSSTCK
jgi:hypothetical protein